MKKLLLAIALLSPAVATPVLLSTPAYAAATQSALGDLTSFEAIATDTLALIDKGDLTAAQLRITDFETAWDLAHSRLRPLNTSQWGVIDDAADAAIASLRAKKPVAAKAKKAVTALIATIENPSAK